jgi:hypothetical protein
MKLVFALHAGPASNQSPTNGWIDDDRGSPITSRMRWITNARQLNKENTIETLFFFSGRTI